MGRSKPTLAYTHTHKNMSDPDCWVDDTPEEMAEKIIRFLDGPEGAAVRKTVATHARQSKRRLTRHDREFTAAMSTLSKCTRFSTAEYLLPRAIIRPDETKLAHLRDLMDVSLVTMQTDVVERQDFSRPGVSKDEQLPRFQEFPAAVDATIDYDEWKRRVDTCEGYQKLHAAQLHADKFIAECEEIAARPCARRCGRFAPNQECSLCERLFCSDSCMDGHREIPALAAECKKIYTKKIAAMAATTTK